MEKYVRKPIQVAIDALYPDPNNPRLALEQPPGYSSAAALFAESTRAAIMDDLGEAAYAVADLVEAIIGQGWMPIDRIIVWQHPDDDENYVVVEGNRRRLALERIRTIEYPRARKKLDRMLAKPGGFVGNQVNDQQALVAHLEQIVADTDRLEVVPIDATSVEELARKLPRVLAVRHIARAKEWGNYAEDLWLLNRYHHLFTDKHGPRTGSFWDDDVVTKVADEASLTRTKAKRQLKAASWFSHFRAEWEDALPPGDEFRREDYYLFENISRKPWIRQQFGIGEDAFAIPPEAEQVLFKWIFAKERGKNPVADRNPNVFYRHENVILWDQMKRYDDEHGTAFASRFDVTNPDDVPTMREVEAEWALHKARRKPHAVLDDLLRRLAELSAEALANEGRFLRAQLEKIREQADTYVKMIDAAEA